MNKRILIIGSGGREHALGWHLSQHYNQVFYMPGNEGTKKNGINIDDKINSDWDNHFKVLKILKMGSFDQIIIGSENILASSLVNFLNHPSIKEQYFGEVFGPTEQAARLESDKFFSYLLMNDLRIPQAKSARSISSDWTMNELKFSYLVSSAGGIVLKAKGLTGGKGVRVYDSKKEALDDFIDFTMKFGEEVLIAERLFGEEFSVFGISNGKKISMFPVIIKDYKTLRGGTIGLNTGGMGSAGSTMLFSDRVFRLTKYDKIICDVQDIMNEIIERMAEIGCPYKGFLYAGVIMTKTGLKVLEFNVRLGDPEAQVLMMLMDEDLSEVIQNCIDKKAVKYIKMKKGAACCVIVASDDYPYSSKTEYKWKIKYDEFRKPENIKVFHSNTNKGSNKLEILSSGGRMLGVTAFSKSGIKEARSAVYDFIPKIEIKGNTQYRTDIGLDLIN